MALKNLIIAAAAAAQVAQARQLDAPVGASTCLLAPGMPADLPTWSQVDSAVRFAEGLSDDLPAAFRGDAVASNGFDEVVAGIFTAMRGEKDFLVGMLDGFFTGPDQWKGDCIATLKTSPLPKMKNALSAARNHQDHKLSKSQATRVVVRAALGQVGSVVKACRVPIVHSVMFTAALAKLSIPLLFGVGTARRTGRNVEAIHGDLERMHEALSSKQYRTAGQYLGSAMFVVLGGAHEKDRIVLGDIETSTPVGMQFAELAATTEELEEFVMEGDALSSDDAEAFVLAYLGAMGTGKSPDATSRVIGEAGKWVDEVVRPYTADDVDCVIGAVDAAVVGEGVSKMYTGLLSPNFPHGADEAVAAFSELAGPEILEAAGSCGVPAGDVEALKSAFDSLASTSLGVSHEGIDVIANSKAITYGLKGCVATGTMGAWGDAGEFMASMTRSVMGSPEPQDNGVALNDPWGVAELQKMLAEAAAAPSPAVVVL